jgi:hypothetical protein
MNQASLLWHPSLGFENFRLKALILFPGLPQI